MTDDNELKSIVVPLQKTGENCYQGYVNFETVKLREALENQRELWRIAESQLNTDDDSRHRVRFMELHAPIAKINAALGSG